MYAISTTSGERIQAEPRMPAECPVCGARVIAKCGDIVSWHWAHTSADCDEWAEADSAWHRTWQEQFPEHMREVTMHPHRADVLTPAGVVEIQHSYLSPEQIARREAFYGRVTWVWDVRDAYRSGRIELRHKPGKPDRWRSFRWKHARKTIACCRGDVLMHLAPGMVLRLGRMWPDAPTGGFGWLTDEVEAIATLLPEARSA
jgi:competence protein CoiA